MEQQGKHIIFFDGDCLICNRFVQILLRIDRKRNSYLVPCNLNQRRLRQQIFPKKQTPSFTYLQQAAILKVKLFSRFVNNWGFLTMHAICLISYRLSGEMHFMITLPKTVIDGLERMNVVPYRRRLSDKDSFNQATII